VSDLRLPKVIGHRGVAASAPENTLAGFALAARLGVTWVELDVQLTADSVPVVFHDDALARTTNGAGRLVETPFGQLRRLDAGAWFAADYAGQKVPSLAEALSVIIGAGLGLCLEVKADETRGARTAEIGLAAARRMWPDNLPPPMVSSFAKSALAVAAKAAPDWPRGLLVDDLPADWAEQARLFGCSSVHTRSSELDPARVRSMKDAGLDVLAFTVNDRGLAERLWSWGVNTVFSDCPDRMIDGGIISE
jgi:glycerophosphoryl diester phosphodiesterase